MKLLRRMALVCGALLMIPACGSDNLGVTNVSPKGALSGLVMDMLSGGPLAGVEVSVVAGGVLLPASGEDPIVTDDAGRFSVADIPAGSVVVEFKGTETHLGALVDAIIDDAAGDFPRENGTAVVGPVVLAPKASSASALRVRLLKPDGSPASGVALSARSDFKWAIMDSAGNPRGEGKAVVEATTDSQGVAALAGLPDLQKLAAFDGLTGLSDIVRIWVAPTDQDGDGVYEFSGTTATFQVNALGTGVPTIVMESAGGPLEVLAATISALAGKTGNSVLASAGAPLFVAFNLPIDQELTAVSIRDEAGRLVVNPATKTVTGTLLTLTFSELARGAEYNLVLRAVARMDGRLLEKTVAAPFFTAMDDPGEVLIANTVADAAGTKGLVTFSSPIGVGSHGNNRLPVVYFDIDIDGSTSVGDAPGELGYSSSPYELTSAEVDPIGPAGRSGFSSQWEVPLPLVNAAPMPRNVKILLDLDSASTAVQRFDSQIVHSLNTVLK